MAALTPTRPTRRGAIGEVLSVSEFPKLLLSLPWLAAKPRGNGQPVLMVPGYGADERSLALLARYLRYLGYRTWGWGLGRNTGNVYTLLPKVIERVNEVSAGEPVFLIGWSLGGYIAREAAREIPDRIRHVITLGTPVVGGPKYTLVAARYEERGYDLDAIEADVEAREANPLRVPVTAMYSRRDGIVSPAACIDRVNPQVEHVRIATRHFGFGFSPVVYGRIADTLAGATG
ncbi:MAG: alpha/beta hydrolase [Xanthomonadales bacterium]|nr:alpha/beta hydrolase [Xanthomonadales bacterium]